MKQTRYSSFLAVSVHWTSAYLAMVALSFCCTPAHCQPAAGHRHALLIGISQYDAFRSPSDDKPAICENLHCQEDVTRIINALVKTFKFNPDPKAGEIVTLTTPAQTTRAAIIAAFAALKASTHPGDLVYIHYAGHGVQVRDETKPTGKGDAIVPSDYKDDLSNVIRGREIGEFLRSLNKDCKPSQIVLTMDCCHSGTGSRGPGQALKRGLTYAEYLVRYAARHNGAKPPDAGGKVDVSAPVRTDERIPGIVVMTACTDSMKAVETNDGPATLGRFSFCLSLALSDAGPHSTYRDVFADVRSMFAARFFDQTPQLDGDPDTYIFGGSAVAPPKAIEVLVDTDGSYLLQAGMLHGVSVGSLYVLYARGAPELTDLFKIAEAEVEPKSIGLSTARLSITKQIKPALKSDDIRGARAVETKHNYEKPSLALDPESVRKEAPDQAQAILQMLGDADTGLRMVSTSVGEGQKFDVALYRDPAVRPRGPLELVRCDTGANICMLDPKQDIPKQVFDALQREARREYVLGLGDRQSQLNPSARLTIRLVPANAQKDEDGTWVFKSDKIDAKEGDPFHPGDFFTVEVQSTSDRPLHLAVLDIETNGDITLAWPDRDSTLEDNIIKQTAPGKWQKLWLGSDTRAPALYRCNTTDPGEVFKLIGTVEYVPFGSLSRGLRRGGQVGPFDDLLEPTANTRTRGPKPVVIPSTAWTVASQMFQVVK